LKYRIEDIESFFRNIKYEAPKPGQDFLDVVSKSVDPLLKTIVADSTVTTMVKYSLDSAIGESKDEIARDIHRKVEAKLDQLNSGITVVNFLITDIRAPRQVQADFDLANQASQQRVQKRKEAEGYAARILSEAGGANAEKILAELKKILAQLKDEDLAEDDPRRAELDSQREYWLSQLAGTSREKIAGARAYKTEVIETARARADYLEALKDEFRNRPELVVRNIYQDAIEEVLENAEEKILIQSDGGEYRIKINRDPSIKRTEAAEKAKEKN
jgi:regulator of protease activity HflC (stomatin/prohibitin superfamily)